MKTSTGSRLAAVALLLGVAVLAYRAEGPTLLAQDPSLPPRLRMKLKTGFGKKGVDELIFAVPKESVKTNKGGVNAWVTNEPYFRVNFIAGDLPLKIWVESKAKRTLLVHLPDGSWAADDGKGGKRPPTLRFANPPSGKYDIWLGRVKREGYGATTLWFTEVK